MNKNKLYKIIPQAKFYDSMGASWRPFSMYGQFSNIRSKYCNTDINGFRFNNTTPQKKISIFDCINRAKKKGGVIIGNSTSFGEGLTGDDKTISNQLTLNTNYEFFNLSGRGYSGFQEIVNFIIHCHKIKNLKKIIIISGLNDSYLPFLIDNYNEDSTPIFGYQKFMNAMLKETLGWKNKIFSFFFKNFFKDQNDLNQMNLLNWKDILIKKKIKKQKKKFNKNLILKEIIDRNIFLWSLISKGLGVELYYFIQPVADWCKTKKSKEEKEIFNLEEKDKKLLKIFKHTKFNKYLFLKKIIFLSAKNNHIPVFDLNEYFNQKKFENKWLFSGKFHLTDEASQILANYIHKKIL